MNEEHLSLVYKHKHMLQIELHLTNLESCSVFYLLNSVLQYQHLQSKNF